MQPNIEGTPPPGTLALPEVTALLIKHYGHSEGLFDLVLQVNIAVGQIGPTPEQALPGAMFGVSGIGLIKVEMKGAMTVDAADVNPKKVAAKRGKRTSSI